MVVGKEKKKNSTVVFNAIFYFVFRARAEAEEARQKAKEDDDVGVYVCGYVCVIQWDSRSPCVQ